jgi:glucan 1,6-alpha-isomaltosidase
VTVVGRPDVKVADIVNPGDYFDGGGLLQWVDATRDGAKEYVKGYVDYFRQLGAAFLRIDFLAWYEAGFDQSEGTMGVAHGRNSYLRALSWMREAAGDMQLSLVMPNLFDHGSGERPYGDLVRIDNDVSYGTWYDLSGGRQTWQPEWSQWNNPFLGFTGYSDISGRGQMILDGDPLIMQTFANDGERQSAISLFTMAGAPIAITDYVDTIADNAHIYQNLEVLALRKEGLVGKPLYNSSHGFEFDPTSRDPERWIGQLPDGSWAVALFNRQDGPGIRTLAVDFASVLGFTGPATVRDLWAHQDLGSMTDYQTALGPHASVLLLVVPPGPAQYQADVGAWGGSARFDNNFKGHTGMGYVTGLETEGSSVAMAISAHAAGNHRVQCRVANSTGTRSTLTVRALDPATGDVHGTAELRVESTPAWHSWQTVTVTLAMNAGTNLVVFSVGSSDQGGVNFDHVTLA